MQESSVWTSLKRETSSFLNIIRVENPIHPGTLDTAWVGVGKSGWWELKDWEGDDWVSKEQAIWMMNWARFGGICGVLAKIAYGDWMYWPALPTFEWMRGIQRKKEIGPSFSFSHVTEDFVRGLARGDAWLIRSQEDPRHNPRPLV